MAISKLKTISGLRLALAILGCACCTAETTALNYLLADSDLAVIGKPVLFVDRANDTVVNLSVIQWLSPAPLGAPSVLQVVWTAPAGARRYWPTTSVPGIWFLKSLGGGTYGVVPVRRSPTGAFVDLYLAAPERGTCPGILAYSSNSPVTDKIALELACAATFESTRYEPGSMIGATVGMGDSAAVHGAFAYLAQLPGSRQKSIGIAGLIAASDPAGLALLEQNLQNLSDEDLARASGPIFTWYRNVDSASVRSIGRIATAPRTNPTFTMGMSMVLAKLHTIDTVPYLTRLLDSPDPNARINAISGLIQFVSGLPIPTPDNFRNGEFMQPSPTQYSNDPSWRGQSLSSRTPSDAELQAVVSFWKNWLHAHPELLQ